MCTIPFSCHAVFVFLDSILFGVIQAEYQNKSKTPSEAHPLQMRTFITSISIYSFLLCVKFYINPKSTPRRLARGYLLYLDHILSYLLLVSGSISSVSLLSILIFLPPLLLWFLIIIWASLPFLMAPQLLNIIISPTWLLQWIITFTCKVWDFLVHIPLPTMIRKAQLQQHLPH